MSQSESEHNSEVASQQLIDAFKKVYQQLDAESCDEALLKTVYNDNLHFEDPFHRIDGLAPFSAYLRGMYKNVTECRFEFSDEIVMNDRAVLIWKMRFAHPKLNGGKVIRVKGVSHIRFTSKVYFHRDYFDSAELFYKHIPILGSVLNVLKKKIAP